MHIAIFQYLWWQPVNFRCIQSDDGNRGSWTSFSHCPSGHFAQGARLVFGGYYYHPKTITSLDFICSTWGITAGTNNAYSGNWEICEPGSFICGIRTKLNYQTKVTGVELRCCIRRQSQNNGKRNNRVNNWSLNPCIYYLLLWPFYCLIKVM